MANGKDNIARRRIQLAARRANLPAEKQVTLLERAQGGSSGPSINEMIPRRPQGEPIPLSFAQERLWIWDRLNPGSVAYNVSLAGRITGRLNLSAISQGLNEIIRRHESLRTNFVELDGKVAQVVAPSRIQELPIVDLGGLNEPEWEAEARRLASEEARRPYNLAEDSLSRITLLKYKEQYAVLRTVHHIISDLWSWEIFIRELGALYKAYCAGHPSSLPDLPIQFADYSYWQRRRLQGEALEAELSYWKRQLEGVQILNLPTDRPHAAIRTYRAASEGVTLSGELAERLRALSQQEGVTLYVVLLAALKILLSRYSGQEDIVVGTVLAGRSHIATESLIGFFLNTMALRVNLSSGHTLRDVIRQAREVFLDAQAHQDMPFEKLIEELKPERSLSRTPLFQVLFSMSSAPPSAGKDRTTPFADLSFSSLAGKPREVRFEEAKFDLTVTMAEMADRIGVSFEYNTDLFDGTTVQRIVRHYQTLLERMVVDSDRSLATLSLLSKAEQHRMLIEYYNLDTDYRPHHCVSGLFEMHAERTPDVVVVEDEHQQLTCNELNRRANQLAGYLRKSGVRAESFVGICMNRSVDLIIGTLGVLKAGAAYVPLDPSLPKNRLRFMIEDSGVAALLSSRRLDHLIPADRLKVIYLDTDWENIAEESSFNLHSRIDGDNAAYVIYTSGSTGNPKGVIASHKAALNRLEWVWKEYPFLDGDICCQKTMISFVDSVFEVLGPILKGVRLSIISEDTVKDPARLIENLSDKQVTRIVLTQTLLRMLFDSDGDLVSQIPALKFWVASGEYLSPDLAQRFLSLLPQCRLLNSYGASEVAADAAFFDLDSWPGGASPISIGLPISNTSIYLLDRNKNLCPIGAHGELHVGGSGLARGYLARPDLTAERFVPDHIGGAAGGRLYSTGDVARCLPNGSMEFLGRGDFQVKIRGFRIELGEIEATLEQHPDVQQAAVIVGENRFGEKRLRGYIVARRRNAPANDDLRSYLMQRLPDYMIPADLLTLDRLPLTPSGKVDRIALSMLDPAQYGDGREYVEPRDLLEAQLVQIWEQTLGVAPIGVKDNFFSLGGTSISAVRLAGHIEKRFGQRLTLNTLMQEGNIANLAKLLSEKIGPLPYPHPTLAVFRREGARPPVFIVHSIGGEALEYYQLARLLGDDQPFYALQSPLGLARADVNRSIEEVASQYLEAIREVQSEGPYLLGGYSWGGIVAFEMAQQLTCQNQEVMLLAIVDTTPPFTVRVKPRIEDEALFLSKALQGLAPAKEEATFLEAVELGSLKSGQLYKRALELLKRWGLLDEDITQETGEDYVRSYIQGYMARIRAYCNYEAKVYPGKITLFRPQPEPKQAYGWSCLSSQPLDIREISGSHWRLMKQPHVQTLAEQLKDCIEKAVALPLPIECA